MTLVWLMLVRVLSKKGRVQFFALSSVDSGWLCDWKNPHGVVLKCTVPMNAMLLKKLFIYQTQNWLVWSMTTGCSMGAYHALNFFLQHPDVFNKVALSGVYDARFFVGRVWRMKLCEFPHPDFYLEPKWWLVHRPVTVKLRSSYVRRSWCLGTRWSSFLL